MILITPEMMEIIKNFTAITNVGIVFPAGKTISVQDGGGIGVDRSSGRTIVAVAELDTAIEQPFAVNDCLQLFSALSMFPNPQIEVDDNEKIVISDSKEKTGKFVFNAASPEVVKAPGVINAPVDPNDITFRLTAEMYQRVFKGVGVVQMPEVIMYGQDGQTYIAAYDIKDKNANTFVVPVGETNEDFSIVIKVDSINKLLKGVDYNVTISSKGMMKATSTGSKINISYFIAGSFKHS